MDKSGQLLYELVSKHLSPVSITRALVSDDIEKIEVCFPTKDSFSNVKELIRFFLFTPKKKTKKKYLQAELLDMADHQSIHLILTTGGTGFSPRDVTPEATRRVIHKEATQLTLAMALTSFQKTKFAALSRAVCGIRNSTLMCNMPGSPKAVDECFMAIVDVLPHAIDLINNSPNANEHKAHAVQSVGTTTHRHICPHKTGTGADDDRNSPYPMVAVDAGIKTILDRIQSVPFAYRDFKSPVNIPDFRASIKDGYAVKANGSCKGMKSVIGYISAGDAIVHDDFDDGSCYKINTGAAIPSHATAIVQIEDTKLSKSANGIEQEIEVLIEPTVGLDIRYCEQNC